MQIIALQNSRCNTYPICVQYGRVALFFSFGQDLAEALEIGPDVAPPVREPEAHDLPVERVEVQRQLVIGALGIEARHVRDQNLHGPRRVPTVADQVLVDEGLAPGLVPPIMLRFAHDPRVLPAPVDVPRGIDDAVPRPHVGRQPPVPVGLMPRGLLLDVLHVPHPLDAPFGGMGSSPSPFVVSAPVHAHDAAEQGYGVFLGQAL